MAAELLRTELPSPWTYGVTGDGRVFFINEKSHSTTWLHPVHNHPVQSGATSMSDLPRGWEQSVTADHIDYYIDHTDLRNTFTHPVTGVAQAVAERRHIEMDPARTDSKRQSKRKAKKKVLDSTPPVKRDDEAPVAYRGWLNFRQEGTRSWKRRWFVLSDLCLFQYKDNSEQKQPLSSLMLPSYTIAYCEKDEESRRHAFKAEHRNMKTQYFAADNNEDMNYWMHTMSLAAAAHIDASSPDPRDRNPNQQNGTAYPPYPPGGQAGQHPPPNDTDAGFYPPGQGRTPPGRHPGQEQQPGQHPGQYPSPQQQQQQQQQQHYGSPPPEDDDGGFGSPPVPPKTDWSEDTPGHDPRDPRDPRDSRYQDPNQSYQDPQNPRYQDQRYADDDTPTDPRYQEVRYPREQPQNDPRQQQDILRHPKDSGYRGPRDSNYQDPRYEDPRGSKFQAQQDPRMDDSYRGSQQLNERDPRYSPQDPRYPLTDKDPRYDIQGSQSLQPPGSQSPEPKYTTQYVTSHPPTSTPAGRHDDPYRQHQQQQQQQQKPASSPSDQSYTRSQPHPRSPQDSQSPSDSYRDPYKPRSLQKEDSLRRLQEWHKEQMHRPPSISSSTQRSPAERPLSDGPRVYKDDRYPGDTSHRESPRDRTPGQAQGQRPGQGQGQGQGHIERPYDPSYQVTKVTTTAVTKTQDPRFEDRVYENLRDQTTDPTVPLHVHVYESAEMRPDQPQQRAPSAAEKEPIPAAYRHQYVEQIADTRTPHTRQDMLVSSETSMERTNEPLYFRYPEAQQPQQPKQVQQLQHPQQRSSYSSSTGEQPRSLGQTPNQGAKYPDRYLDTSRASLDRHNTSASDTTSLKRPVSSQSGSVDRYGRRNETSSGIFDTSNREQQQPEPKDSRVYEPVDGASYRRMPDRQRDADARRPDSRYSDSSSSLSRQQQEQQRRGEDRTSAYQPARPDSGRDKQPTVRHDSTRTKPPSDATYRQNQSGVDTTTQFDRRALGAPSQGHDPTYIQRLEDKERKRLEKYIHRSNNRLSWDGILDGRKTAHDPIDSVDARRSLDFEVGHSRGTPPLASSSLQRGTKHHNLSASKFDENQNIAPDYGTAKSWRSLNQPDDEDLSTGQFSPKSGQFSSKSGQLSPKSGSVSGSGRHESFAQLSPTSITKLDKLDNENKLNKSLGALELGAERERKLVMLERERERQREREGRGQKWGGQEMSEGQRYTGRTPEQPYMSDGPRGAVATSPVVPGRGQQYKPVGYEIDPIKEDPDMADEDILTTRKLRDLQKHLGATTRLRLSISASDLVGKSHEELVLLLIQLRRSHAQLENARDYFRGLLDQTRSNEKEYKIKRKNSIGRLQDVLEREHDKYTENKKQFDEIEKQIEVHKPLINLLENIVTMGSLYGGDNLMLKSQYKSHVIPPDDLKPPKGMILFSRQHQEHKLTNKQEQELKQLTEDEVDLEEKLQELFKLDKELQECSFNVTSLQEDKELLEKALQGVHRDEMMMQDPRDLDRLAQQRRTIESELTKVRQQLADASRQLEETSAENAKVENEVILLRRKIYGLSRGQPSPTLPHDSRTRQKLERELLDIQSIMTDLSKQGERLSQVMRSLKPEQSNEQPFTETDMDTMVSQDISIISRPYQGHDPSQRSSSLPPSGSGAKSYEDLNDKGFFSHASPVLDRRTKASTLPASYGSPQGQSQGRIEPPQGYRGQGHPSGTGTGRPSTQSRSSSLGPSYQSPRSGTPTDPSRSYQGQSSSRPYQDYPSPNSTRDRREQESRYNSSYVTKTQTTTLQSSAPIDPRDQRSKVDEKWRSPPAGGTPAYQKPTSEVHPQRQSSSGFARWQSPEGSPHSPSDQQSQRSSTLPGGNTSSSFDQSRDRHDDSMTYSPLDISDADDNTKRYYGLLPKEKPRTQTVRDVKKRESERRSRDRYRTPSEEYGSEELPPAMQRSKSLPRRVAPPPIPGYDPLPKRSQDDIFMRPKSSGGQDPEKRKSASQRLFPSGDRPSTSNTRNPEHARRMSDIYTPRPFGSPRPSTATVRPVDPARESPRIDYAKREAEPSYLTTRSSSSTVATVRPVVTATSSITMTTTHVNRSDPSMTTITMATVKPMSATFDSPKKSKDRLRRKTVSSTEPTRMEQDQPMRKPMIHSVAGDLISSRMFDDKIPDYVRSETSKDTMFDMGTIDREVLYMPEKVEIPERYLPDSDSEEDWTEEEKLLRKEKSNSIRRMLAAHSLQEWKESELTSRTPEIHQQVAAERRQRERILDIRQALAKEVTQRSREVAATRRRTLTDGTPQEVESSYSTYQHSMVAS